jgi:hypothetical protein
MIAMRKTENMITKYDDICIQFDYNYDNKTDMWYSFYIVENNKHLNLFFFLI